jgi:hypothetical protein
MDGATIGVDLLETLDGRMMNPRVLSEDDDRC